MEIVPAQTNIDFLRRAPVCAALSGGLILLSVVMWFVWGGFKLGIEFAGGTLLQVKLPEVEPGGIGIGRIRDAVTALGYPDAAIVTFGDASENTFQISLKVSEEEVAERSVAAGARPASGGAQASEAVSIPESEPGTGATAAVGAPTDEQPAGAPQEAGEPPEAEAAAPSPGSVEAEPPAEETPSEEAAAADGSATQKGDEAETTPADAYRGVAPRESLIREVGEGLERELGTPIELERAESIGPRVGSELTRIGFEAVLGVGLLILIYIWLRFDLRYAPGAVIALLHDVLITAGVFVIFQLEFNLQVLAALLVVLGYSLNDTIVVYDRIRENIERRGSTQIVDVVNQSVNQTLSRSLLTSLTTLLVVMALLVLGGPVIRDFALALLIGIVVGTYSSIYVASALLIFVERRWKMA